MTTIYFVRHAEPDYNNHDDMNRELSAKGLKDRELVTEFLKEKGIDVVLSSPYKRAKDTVRQFAELEGMEIITIDDFKERKVDSEWIEDFNTFCKMQWKDFEYKLSDGESLGEVQCRNIRAIDKVLEEYNGKSIAIGSHGTALSTIIHYYDDSFGYEEFETIRSLMPWVVEFVFEEKKCVKIQKHNLFEKVYLKPMTYEMYHTFFQEYQNDMDLYLDESDYFTYCYDKEKVDEYIQKQIDLERIPFAIMYGDEIVGELKLYNIEEKKSATLGITMKNANYKDCGFGTQAEKLAIDYVFHELDIPVLYADSVLTNTRSQHVLEKVGFQLVLQDEERKHYKIERETSCT